MASDRYRAVSNVFKAKYDSDEDLTEEQRKKIRESSDPEATRTAAWEEADMYPKLKKTMKGMWYGDKRAKK